MKENKKQNTEKLEELKKTADKSFKTKYTNKKKIATAALCLLGLATIGTVTPIIVSNANAKVDVTVKSSNTAMEKYKVEVKKGTKISKIKVVELEGYDFIGFFKDEACTKAYQPTDTLENDSTIYESYAQKQMASVMIGDKAVAVPLTSNITIGDAIKNIETLPYETSGVVYLDEACTQEADLNSPMTTSTTLYTKAATLDKLSFEWDNKTSSWGVKAVNTSISGEVVIPASYTKDGKSGEVTTISYRAFIDCTKLTSVTIPNSVTTIDVNAFFRCYDLTSITIPNSVTTIEAVAFSWCTSLVEITIPNSVTTIGEDVFSGCSSLTSVTIPNSVTTIGESAFRWCYDLTEITIPNSVTTIGFCAFAECRGLTEITIPNSVTTIGESAFGSCSGLTSITIPSSVTTIGKSAFSGCSALTSVTIPNSVTTISDRAFYKCYDLTSINIPNSVTTIGEYVFSDCSSLTSITIPNSVTTIKAAAFMSCSGLTKIVIPDSVTTIGNSAFAICSGLTSITIPNSVTTIGDDVFYGCSSLTSVTIDSATIANKLTSTSSNGHVIGYAKTVYIKTGLNTASSTYLKNYFTKQATSDKDGYDMWVKKS